MNKLSSILSNSDFIINKYYEKNNISIIDTNKGKYVIKKRYSGEKDLYEYLIDKNYNFLLDRLEYGDYDLFPYIEEKNIPKEEKAIDLVYLLSLLHNKTLFYRNIILDEVKATYEYLNKKIDDLNKYYFDMQDIIEQRVYMNPAEYFLIRNMSLIYSSLSFSKEKLKEWYNYKITQKKERIVLLHNRPSIDHLLDGDNRYLISWDNSKRDIPIYDFVYFYKHNNIDLEMTSLFDIYQSKFLYTKEEYLLFLVLITIPEKMKFSKNHFEDCEKATYIIEYLNNTRDFILKENEKDKNEDKYEFKEQ